jgi:hypothetical protein
MLFAFFSCFGLMGFGKSKNAFAFFSCFGLMASAT